MAGSFGGLVASYSRRLAEVLVVAGGGGGGVTNTDNGGGGGGAGGVQSFYALTTPGVPITITIGAGGPTLINVSTELAARGSDSSFGDKTYLGGGCGGGYFSGFSTQRFSGIEGGSSGGSSVSVTQRGVQNPIDYQGNIGGLGYNGYGGGGGGGASAAGGSAVPTSTGLAGKGGDGINTLITGISSYFGGGGGGGAAVINQSSSSDKSNVGGLGGGGKGCGASWPAVAGTVNSGGGGGGGIDGSRLPKAGGSGVVILAYPNTIANLTSISAGLSYTLDTTSRSGYKVYKFTAGTGTVRF